VSWNDEILLRQW